MASELGTIECTLSDVLYGRDSTLVITLHAQSTEKRAVEKIYDAVRIGQEDPQKRLTAQFSWHKEKRSLNANAYFHVIVGRIAKVLGESEELIKQQLVTDYGAQAGFAIIPINDDISKMGIPYYRWVNDFTNDKGIKCGQYAIYKPTHLLDTAEMARLIDGAISEAKQLGIETKTPRELDEIKALWATQKE